MKEILAFTAFRYSSSAYNIIHILSDFSDGPLIRPPNVPLTSPTPHAESSWPMCHSSFNPLSSTHMHLSKIVRKQHVQDPAHRSGVDT